MKGKFLIPPALRAGQNPYKHTSAKENVSGAKEYFKKNYNPKDPFFVKDEKQGRNMNNLWSGYKLGGKGNILAGASILGGGSIYLSTAEGRERKGMVEEQSQYQDVESLQSTRGDMVGYQAQIPGGSGFNTSGDLVFAMHKTRHTGQF